MGDFQGHPFRGNQWTDGRTMGISSPASTSRRVQRYTGALRQQRADALVHTKTKEEWKDEAERARIEATGWANKNAEVGGKIFAQQAMNRDLARETALYRQTQQACGDAWSRWRDLPSRPRNADMPEIGSAEMASLPLDARAAALAYREAQRDAIVASDAKMNAEAAWRAAHAGEMLALRQEQAGYEKNLRAAVARQEIATRAYQNYEREAARSVQKTATAREPRNTAATQYHAADEESQRTLDWISEDGGARIMRMRDGTYVDVRAGQTPIVIRPGFKATVRDGKEFKSRLEGMFPGIVVEGLPRKADPHILTLVHDEFQALRDEFPEVAIRKVKMNAGGMRGVAYPTADKITLGREGVESFTAAHVGFARGNRRVDPDKNPSFHDGQRNYAGLVRHEFAHQLHFQYPEILRDFDAEVGKLPFAVRTKITAYARKDNMERFAETFTMMKYGDEGTKKHPAVKIMADVIARFLANKRRKP